MTTPEWAYEFQNADRVSLRAFEPSYQPGPEPSATRRESLTGLVAVIEEERLSWAEATRSLGLSELDVRNGVNSGTYPAVRPDSERPFSLLDIRDISRLNRTGRRRLNSVIPVPNITWKAP